MDPTLRSVEQLAADLRRLGVAEGDLLMVHASLRAIGPVDGGAGGVLDTVISTIGSHGTMVMNIGARNDWAWVNDHPESDRVALLRDAEPFHSLTTPADPDNGLLAEVFRTRPGTVLGDHPDARFAGFGSLAARVVGDVPWNDYYGTGSPLERFVHAGGRVLRLGANLDTVTLLHYAEYLAHVPAKRRVRRHCRVQGPRGPEVRVVSCLDDSDGIVDYPGEDYFAVIAREYLDAGRAHQGTVGKARSELIEGTDLVEFAVAWMEANLRGGDQ
jgi:aminoglycoside N3'-acetyltransferase